MDHHIFSYTKLIALKATTPRVSSETGSDPFLLRNQSHVTPLSQKNGKGKSYSFEKKIRTESISI